MTCRGDVRLGERIDCFVPYFFGFRNKIYLMNTGLYRNISNLLLKRWKENRWILCSANYF